VEGERGRYWGRFGAAGVLAYDPAKGVLLQHRAIWSHNGGTWGLPGGALHEGEDAVVGALREAYEEAAVPAESVDVLFTSVLDLGYWSYTTVVVRVTEPFDPVISDPESIELLWIPLADVERQELHPGFAAAWPALWERLASEA
jgi:8-oxo-dGTP pyrophosphatase MutT (NUDIX family)